MTEKEYLVLLSTFVPFGPARIKLLLEYFGNAKSIWTVAETKLRKLGLGEERTTEFLSHRTSIDPKKYFRDLKKSGISYLTIFDKDYPRALKEIDDAPHVLYIKGKFTKSDETAVSIVGSRKMTAYGKEVTARFAGELASYGISIISGLARGIDTEAHQNAIAAGGRTIAVFGAGLDNIYPPENTNLAGSIAKHGAVISEYPLSYPALPLNFAARNRIISGLSRAVIVVEGAEKSGTLLTATHAAKQGREVFAVPGQITSPLSGAPLFLLKNGAKIATKPGDILEELNLQIEVNREEVERIMPTDKVEEKIIGFLENESLHLDELARISSLGTATITAKLTIMELKGMVKNLGGGVYRKK